MQNEFLSKTVELTMGQILLATGFFLLVGFLFFALGAGWATNML